MSSVRFALEKLNEAVERLDYSLVQGEALSTSEQVINSENITQRLDRAIRTVELLLED